MRRLALGIDYGTNSVRALLVDVDSGEEVATHVAPFRSGEAGVLLDPGDSNLARQSPRDYQEGFFEAVRGALVGLTENHEVVGIGVDTTGSTPIPVDAECRPLAMRPEFEGNLAAQAWLWKDHTAYAEAAEITERAADLPYLAKCGGSYSSEWFFSKILHCERVAPDVFAAAYTWLECADYIPAWLTGQRDPDKVKRGACAAGHKALYNRAWGGPPSGAFLAGLSPALAEMSARAFREVVPSDRVAGRLDAEVAARSGLAPGIPVAVGAIDAHLGAVGSGIKAGAMVKILGTSTCDILVAPLGSLPDIPGIAGIAEESVLPGMLGLEAGQAAVGDLFNWFVKHLCPPEFAGPDAHEKLTAAAQRLRPGESGLIALDWNNGNRNILADPLLSGLLVGQTLHTTAPEVYRALVEATAFGSLRIIERLEEYGVEIAEIVCGGGIAEKSPFAMQIYADILNRPIKLSRSAQTCALGAAIFGAVAGGAFPSVSAAQERMTGVRDHAYRPNLERRTAYAELYLIYRELHDHFGSSQVMHRLRRVESLKTLRGADESGQSGRG